MSRRAILVLVALLAVVAPQTARAGTGSFDSSTDTPAVTATHTALSGTGDSVLATSQSTAGRAVVGWAKATSGATYGVWGQSDAQLGRGVYGYATAPVGGAKGVYGESAADGGTGVYGIASSLGSGVTYGVYGQSASTNGRGVWGTTTAGSGSTYGVVGQSYSSEGTGVYGSAVGFSGNTIGVRGEAGSPEGYGVAGGGGRRGVSGITTGIGNLSYGVYSATDLGVVGHLVAKNGNVAGTCTVAANTTSKTCTFPAAFATGTVPIVVLTPRANPQTTYWITAPTTTGFTINVAAAKPVGRTFNYVVVGKLSSL